MEAYEKLTTKHKKFVEEYIFNGFNATEAYEVVYNTANKGTAYRGSGRLMRREDILLDIGERLEPDALERQKLRYRVLEEVKDIAFITEKEVKRYGDVFDETTDDNTRLKAIELLLKHFNVPQSYKDKMMELDIKLKEAQIAAILAKVGTTEDEEDMLADDILAILSMGDDEDDGE